MRYKAQRRWLLTETSFNARNASLLPLRTVISFFFRDNIRRRISKITVSSFAMPDKNGKETTKQEVACNGENVDGKVRGDEEKRDDKSDYPLNRGRKEGKKTQSAR